MFLNPYQIARCRTTKDHNVSIRNIVGCILTMSQTAGLTISLYNVKYFPRKMQVVFSSKTAEDRKNSRAQYCAEKYSLQ